MGVFFCLQPTSCRSLRRQDISSRDIDYVRYVGPGLTWGRILSTSVKSMWSTDIKCKYIFMFPLQNLARKELTKLSRYVRNGGKEVPSVECHSMASMYNIRVKITLEYTNTKSDPRQNVGARAFSSSPGVPRGKLPSQYTFRTIWLSQGFGIIKVAPVVPEICPGQI